MTNSVSVHLTKKKIPVDAVVAVVFTAIVGADVVDCDSMEEVVGVAALSKTAQLHILL